MINGCATTITLVYQGVVMDQSRANQKDPFTTTHFTQ